MSDVINIISVSAVVLFASIANSLSGFGFGLLSLPFLTLLYGPRTAVPLEVVLGGALNVVLLSRCYRHVELRNVLYILAGAIVGVPIGSYVLARYDVQFLRILISVVAISSAILLFMGIRKTFRREYLAGSLIGLLSGGLKGSVGMPGTPVVLFGLNQGWRKEAFRATIIAYFTVLSIIAVPAFLKFGLLTGAIGKLGLIGLPSLLVGSLAGTKLRSIVPEPLFRRIALALIALAAILGIVTAFCRAR
jgi:uncharacterized membrane protein YfcA